ncbi:MAG: hypothetical protein IJB24_00700 [Clostridia bacterium]|nr:hypothetical protein [Clostridia bacterium]
MYRKALALFLTVFLLFTGVIGQFNVSYATEGIAENDITVDVDTEAVASETETEESEAVTVEPTESETIEEASEPMQRSAVVSEEAQPVAETESALSLTPEQLAAIRDTDVIFEERAGSPVISEATGNYVVLYYTTQKDPSGADVTGIYSYDSVSDTYTPVAYWGAPEVTYEYICTTIEQAIEWACICTAVGGFGEGVVIAGVRIYICEMYHVPTDGEVWGQNYFNAHWPGVPLVPTQILRAPGYEDEMIHIHTGFDKHLYAQNNVLIDNASAHCPNNPNPVAVRVADGGLMIADGCLIMDTTIPLDPVNKTGYKGTGVLLTTMDPENKVYPMVELNGGALELVGNTQIHNFAIGVDSDYGVTRLREPSPTLGTWNIDNNVLSVNLAYGTYLGKWCNNISQINNVSVFLEDVEKWSSGDIILASGYRTNPVQGQPDIKTPVIASDRSKIVIQNEMDLSYSMAVSFYNGITSDPYPVIRFEIASVYNIQLNKWYFTLYEAVADSRNNDELVFYNNTNEGYTVYIPHNLTIRSSYKGEKPGGKSDIRAGNNCSATWNSRIVNAVIVGLNTNPTNNMVVKFGTNDTSKEYAELTFDTNNKCRHLENYGTAYLYPNFTMVRGNCEYGGSVCSVGFTYLDGAEILNCTAGASGNGGAVAVTQGAFYFRSGLIDNCTAGKGGAIYNNVGGTVELTGGTISNCKAPTGGAVYQDGVFGLGGKVRFTGCGPNDEFYLPSTATKDIATGSKVITKLSDFDLGTNKVRITLGMGDSNLYDGRNVVVSGAGKVTQTDLAKFTLTNLSNYNKDLFATFNFVYTASDATPGNIGKSVLELDITLTVKYGDITITKTVSANGGKVDKDQSFVFDIVGTSTGTKDINLTVIIYGNGSVTLKDLPLGTYKVTERTDWSWRYAKSSVQVSLDGGAKTTATSKTFTLSADQTRTVAFTNILTNKKWLADVCYAVNKFKEV